MHRSVTVRYLVVSLFLSFSVSTAAVVSVAGKVKGLTGIDLQGAGVTLVGSPDIQATSGDSGVYLLEGDIDAVGTVGTVGSVSMSTRILVHRDGISVSAPPSSSLDMNLYSLRGRRIARLSKENLSGPAYLPLPALPAGTYILRGTIEGMAFTTKMSIGGAVADGGAAVTVGRSRILAKRAAAAGIDSVKVSLAGYRDTTVALPSYQCSLEVVLTAEPVMSRTALDSLLALAPWDTMATLINSLFYAYIYPEGAVIPDPADALEEVVCRLEQLYLDIENSTTSLSWPQLKYALKDLQDKYILGQEVADRETLARAAHLLLLEYTGALGWSMTGTPAEHHELIYKADGPSWESPYRPFTYGDYEFGYDPSRLDNTSSFTPCGQFLLYPIAAHIAKDAATEEEAVQALFYWMQANVFHSYMNLSEGIDWSTDAYTNYDMVDSMYNTGYYDIPPIFEERVMGCHIAIRLLGAMANSIGIPALTSDYTYNDFGQHGTTLFPTFEKIVHGDFMTDYWHMPHEDMILSYSDFDSIMTAYDQNYADYCEDLETRHGQELLMYRTGNELFVSGHIVLCPSEKDSMIELFTERGVTFTCTPQAEGDCERCEADTSDHIPIKGILELYRESLAQP